MNMNIITANNMKRKISVFAMCVPLLVQAQDKSHNYIKEIQHLDSTGTITNVEYFNGIGDLTEVASTNCGSEANIFTFTTYDSKGRKSKIYNAVPGHGQSLDFMTKSDFEHASYNFYKDNFAFNEYLYDINDRVIREDIGGKNWHSHVKNNTITYGTNTAADKVILYSNLICSSTLSTQSPEIIKSSSSGSTKTTTSSKQGNDQSDLITQYYPAGSLEKETIKDADGNLLTIFKDLYGNVVLERRSQGDTYYVYDKLGQLRYVLPPKYQEDADLGAYAYQYEYDKRGHLVKKTLPGAEYAQYWYDKEDHLVFTQDAQLRGKQLYRFYLYDSNGRVVVSGTSPVCNTNVGNLILICSYNQSLSGFMNTGYNFNLNCISTTGATIEKVYFYDTYSFLSGSHRSDFKDLTPPSTGEANGLLAGSIVIASNGEYIYTVNCYDPKGNLTSCFVKSINGYTAKTTNTYSLTNKLKNTTTEVDIKYGVPFMVTEVNEYSNKNDMINNKTIMLSHGAGDCVTNIKYKYDSFNRIQNIIRPGKAGVVQYSYDDIHGWPVLIKSNSFTEQISFTDGLGTPCYNGNISSIKWKTNSFNQERGYKFYYDNLNRLTDAVYGEGNALTDAVNHYDESAEYDLNGNITFLKRYGKKQNGEYGVVDDLTMTLNGNQLQEVTDKGEKIVYKGALDFNNAANGNSSFKYNDFGALISDASRGISMIEYDNFKNPVRIQFKNGNVTRYIYSGEGEKLRTIYYTAMPNVSVSEGTTHELTSAETLEVDSVDYLMGGNLILNNARIDTYLFDGGYCKAYVPFVCIARPHFPMSCDDDEDKTSDSQENIKNYQKLMKEWEAAMAAHRATDAFNFYYFNKDHLGNNREVTDENGTIHQEINYYPFGTPFFDASATKKADFQMFKYNGKEFDEMHGLNTYDYGARQYNPALARWDRLDPVCEKYYNVSPYAYCGDNPIVLFDIKGFYPKYFVKRYTREAKAFHAVGVSGTIVSYTARETYFKFTESAAYVLSLVSGIPIKYVNAAELMEFSGQPSGNCITLGSSPYHARILTSPYYISGKGSQNYNLWLREFSHEVGHIKQIAREHNVGLYVLKTLCGYVKTMSHDKAPREKEAEQGTNTFDDFNSFIKTIYKTNVETLLKSNKSEVDKINTLKKWWTDFTSKGK